MTRHKTAYLTRRAGRRLTGQEAEAIDEIGERTEQRRTCRTVLESARGSPQSLKWLPAKTPRASKAKYLPPRGG
jgi:hypothetical protein